MKSKNKNTETKNLEQFIKEFSGIISAFQSGVEGVMELITGSFENTKKESYEITSLFTQARGEAEAIFSVFSAIASDVCIN